MTRYLTRPTCDPRGPHPRFLAWVAAAVLLATSAALAGEAGEGAPTDAGPAPLIFLVRHAEKAADDPEDPALTDAGRRRAQQLAVVLAEAHVTHLFSTEFRRTRETLEPLSRATSLPIAVVAAKDQAAQVEALRVLPAGSVAVVAGHSNTIPAIACALAEGVPGLDCQTPGGPKLDERRHDQLILVVRPSAGPPSGPPRAVVLHYGD